MIDLNNKYDWHLNKEQSFIKSDILTKNGFKHAYFTRKVKNNTPNKRHPTDKNNQSSTEVEVKSDQNKSSAEAERNNIKNKKEQMDKKNFPLLLLTLKNQAK